jgi:glycosyltransferase involved in cell wall biosynthesis
MSAKKNIPLLSIAIITYNQSAFLNELIKSILSQKTNFQYEILICDDGSIDNTKDLSLNYAQKYKNKITYLRHENNLGISHNCNQGIRNAKGKYFAIVGGDDLFLPGKIQTQIKFMEENPRMVLTYHSVDVFDSKTNNTLYFTNRSLNDTPRNFLELIQKPIPGSSSVVCRKDSIPNSGFNIAYPTVSEWLYFIEVASKGEIAFLPNVLCRYRKHGNQESARSLNYLRETLSSLNDVRNKFGHLQGVNSALNRGIARFIAGEAYRQLMNNERKLSRELLKESMKSDFRLPYFFVFILSFSPLPTEIYTKFRFFLKKFI